MANEKRSTVWVDVNGKTRQTILLGNASLATVQNDLIAVSYADYQQHWEGVPTVNGSPAPATGAYQSVNDYAVLTFTDASGSLVYVTLPAPRSTIFKADQETVDPVAIATLIGNVVGTVLTGGGGVVTAYVGGFRRRKLLEYQ